MNKKICLIILLFLLTACAPATQPVVDVPPLQTSTAVEATPAIPDTPEPTSNFVMTALPPIAESETPAVATSGAGCASADAIKLGQSIADDYAFTSAEEVLTWFCNGAEFEDILVALQTEEMTDVPAGELLSMLADGLSWDEIWLGIGLTAE